MSVTKDSNVVATANVKYKVAVCSGRLALANEFLVFFFISLYFEYDFHNK